VSTSRRRRSPLLTQACVRNELVLVSLLRLPHHSSEISGDKVVEAVENVPTTLGADKPTKNVMLGVDKPTNKITTCCAAPHHAVLQPLAC